MDVAPRKSRILGVGLVLALAGALVAIWGFKAPSDGTPTSDPDPADARGAETAHRLPLLPAPRQEARRDAAAPPNDAAGGVSQGAPPRPLPDEAAAWPPGAAAVVAIELLLPPAWEQIPLTVYALAPGARGGSRADTRPAVTIEAGVTQALLPLPAEGTWDVGVSGPYGGLLLRDVLVEARTPLTFDLRQARPVRFHYDLQVDLEAARAAAPDLRLSTSDGVACPGRGEGHLLGITCGDLAPSSVPVLTPTPIEVHAQTHRDVLGTAQAPGQRWRCVPTRVRPGDDVRVVAVPLAALVVELEVATPLPASWTPARPPMSAGWRVWIGLDVTGVGTEVTLHGVGTFMDEHGVLASPTSSLLLPAGTWALAPALRELRVEGPAEVTLAAGEQRKVRVRLVPDPEQVPAALRTTAAPRHDVRLRPVPAPPEGEQVVFGAEHEVEGERAWSSGRVRMLDGSLEVSEGERIHRVLLLDLPDRASAPFTLPERGTLEVAMLPAGFLVAVPDAEVSAALGPLRLRRADGLPLPQVALSGLGDDGRDLARAEVRLVPEVRVQELAVLGPIPAGRIELEVLLGPAVVGTVSAQVEAGRRVPLPIPVPRPAAPR